MTELQKLLRWAMREKLYIVIDPYDGMDIYDYAMPLPDYWEWLPIVTGRSLLIALRKAKRKLRKG